LWGRVKLAELNEKLEKERKQRQLEREAKERIKKRKEEEKKKKKKEKERKKREEAMRENMRRREERKEDRKDMTELERRIENHTGLERAGRSFMDYLNYGKNVRSAEIPFNEPIPGCKYNITKAKGFVVILLNKSILKEFLLKTREYLLNISYQLFDGTGRKVSLNIVSVSQWERSIQESDGSFSTNMEVHTHNTKFRTFMSRNQITTKCDEVIEMLVDRMMTPAGASGLSFKAGILIRVEYYANMSSEKKGKKEKNGWKVG